MAKQIRTYLFCYDDHRGFSEDVRKRFIDDTRYKVSSFPDRDEFITNLEAEKERSSCKIAILGAHDTAEQYELIDRMTLDIKRIDPKTGIIILGPPEKMDEIKKIIKFNIDAYIPKNTNAILRLHNIVKKLISEYNIGIFRKKRNFSFYTLMAFLVLSALLILLAFFRLPQYF